MHKELDIHYKLSKKLIVNKFEDNRVVMHGYGLVINLIITQLVREM